MLKGELSDFTVGLVDISWEILGIVTAGLRACDNVGGEWVIWVGREIVVGSSEVGELVVERCKKLREGEMKGIE
ncbi:hypothetical protein Tco_0252859 [Tanacetum coccineum]